MASIKVSEFTNIPQGKLGLIALRGSETLAQKINDAIVACRKDFEIEHENAIVFDGYHKDSYLINVEFPRFSTGEGKCVINDSIRGYDLFIIADCFNYSVTYNKNLFEIIAPFLKDRGKLVGQFIDYSKAPKSLRNIKTDHPEFEPELLTLKKIYASMADAGLKILERTNLGSPEGKEKDFKRQVGDEKIALVTYIAEK